MDGQRGDLDLQVLVQREAAEDPVQFVIGFHVEHGVVCVFPNYPPDSCKAPILLDSLRVFLFQPLKAFDVWGVEVGREVDIHAGKEQHFFLSVCYEAD